MYHVMTSSASTHCKRGFAVVVGNHHRIHAYVFPTHQAAIAIGLIVVFIATRPASRTDMYTRGCRLNRECRGCREFGHHTPAIQIPRWILGFRPIPRHQHRSGATRCFMSHQNDKFVLDRTIHITQQTVQSCASSPPCSQPSANASDGP